MTPEPSRHARCGRCRARADPQRGQATVEFALVLPLILLVAVGVVQVARVTASQVAVIDAARAGARAAAVDPDLRVARSAALGPPGSDVTMHLTPGEPELVTVAVSTRVRLMPGLGWSDVTVSASSTHAVERTD